MRIIFSCILFLFTFLSVKAQSAYTVETVPDPKRLDGGYVSNPDNILDASTVSTINSVLRSLEDSTTVEVAVVVLQSIGDIVPEDFRYDLFNYWHIGKKAKDNGLLILMVMDQRRFEFETGYGLESSLTDAMCKQIQMEYMVPLAKEGKYSDAVLAGVLQVNKVLTDPVYRDEIYADSEANSSLQPWWRKHAGNTILAIFGIAYTAIAGISFASRKKTLKKAPQYVQRQYNGAYSAMKFLFLNLGIPFGFYAWQQLTGSIRVFEFWAFIYGLFMLLLLEKRIRINRYILHDSAEKEPQETYNLLAKSHSNGWLAASIFFPVPFIFYSLLNRTRMQHLRNSPPMGADGKTPMIKLDEVKDDEFLKAVQLTEEKLKSVDYDVWKDPVSNQLKIFRFENYFSKYKACPNCNAKAYRMVKNVTLTSPTYDSTGQGRKTYNCAACNYAHDELYTIAKLTRSSSGSGGSGGGGGSSWGGGSSGGGGAGSSW